MSLTQRFQGNIELKISSTSGKYFPLLLPKSTTKINLEDSKDRMISTVIFVSSRAFKVNIQHQRQGGVSLIIASSNSLEKDDYFPLNLRISN